VEESAQSAVGWFTAHSVSTRLNCAATVVDFVEAGAAIGHETVVCFQGFSEEGWCATVSASSSQVYTASGLGSAVVGVEISLSERFSEAQSPAVCVDDFDVVSVGTIDCYSTSTA
jgi:hypothetical protein